MIIEKSMEDNGGQIAVSHMSAELLFCLAANVRTTICKNCDKTWFCWKKCRFWRVISLVYWCFLP